MWNFSIPYKLKHYIDIIVQPSYTFTVTDTGYKGLAGGKPICLILARGASYDNDSPIAFQKKYLEFILGFIGFTDIKNVFCQPMLADENTVKKAQDAAINNAKTIAAAF
jgi:FMN-dependent NADH-azoreductase